MHREHIEKFDLFTAAKCFRFFSQIEFQLKKSCYKDVGSTSSYIHEGRLRCVDKYVQDLKQNVYIQIDDTILIPVHGLHFTLIEQLKNMFRKYV